MNGTSHRTVSPAPTGPTPAPRASPVARRLRLGDDVSAFWRLAITRRIVAHLPRPSLPPSAASKLLALFVALVALATANAATLAGLHGRRLSVHRPTPPTTTKEGLRDLRLYSGSAAGATSYTNTTTPSKPTSQPSSLVTRSHLASLQGFVRRSDDDFIGKYVDAAAVSPDFKT